MVAGISAGFHLMLPYNLKVAHFHVTSVTTCFDSYPSLTVSQILQALHFLAKTSRQQEIRKQILSYEHSESRFAVLRYLFHFKFVL